MQSGSAPITVGAGGGQVGHGGGSGHVGQVGHVGHSGQSGHSGSGGWQTVQLAVQSPGAGQPLVPSQTSVPFWIPSPQTGCGGGIDPVNPIGARETISFAILIVPLSAGFPQMSNHIEPQMFAFAVAK